MTGTIAPKGWRSFVAAWMSALVLLVAGIAGLLAASDPFFVWRADPPWLSAREGQNLNLDLRHRLWKPLALARAPAELVLVGSSRVYRGIDPRDITSHAGKTIFNFGISSVSLQEMEAIAGLLGSLAPARQVIMGLDEYMFNELGSPPAAAVPPQISDPDWHRQALVRTVLSLEAVRGFVDLWFGKPSEAGVWRRDGFKSTPPRTPRRTASLYQWQQFRDTPFLPERLAALRQVFAAFKAAGLMPLVYLSPISGPMQARLREAGRWQEYQDWRRDVAAIAASFGIVLHDLATDHPFQGYDPQLGSSIDWFDHHHHTPRVGRWILSRLGLREPDR